MRFRGVMGVIIPLAMVAAVVGAYVKGRNDVLIGEFKQYEGNMLTLTHWETNHPPRTEAVREGTLLLFGESNPEDLGGASIRLRSSQHEPHPSHGVQRTYFHTGGIQQVS